MTSSVASGVKMLIPSCKVRMVEADQDVDSNSVFLNMSLFVLFFSNMLINFILTCELFVQICTGLFVSHVLPLSESQMIY